MAAIIAAREFTPFRTVVVAVFAVPAFPPNLPVAILRLLCGVRRINFEVSPGRFGIESDDRGRFLPPLSLLLLLIVRTMSVVFFLDGFGKGLFVVTDRNHT